MGQNENCGVKRRVLPPPAPPVHVRPGATNGSEHAPSHDPGTDFLAAPRSVIVIDPIRAASLSMHLPPSASGNYPVVQGLTADAERIAGALIRTCSVAVNGNGEALDSDSRHFMPPFGLPPNTKAQLPAGTSGGIARILSATE